MENWNSMGGTVGWNSFETVMLEQCRWKSVGGKLRWKSGTVLVAQCGGSVEQCWWNSGTVLVEQWNSDGETVQQ